MNETKKPFFLDNTDWLRKILNKHIAQIYPTQDFEKMDELMNSIDGKKVYYSLLGESMTARMIKNGTKYYIKHNPGHIALFIGMPIVIFLIVLSGRMEHGGWLTGLAVIIGALLVMAYKSD